jgi:TolA-binding protein
MSGLDQALRELADRAPAEPLSARARDRALDAALATAIAPRRRRWLAPAGIGVGLALAAAAAVALLVARDSSSPVRPHAVALAPAAWTSVGHARVRLAAGGEAWQAGDGEVRLQAGRVEVEVDPAARRSFRVVAPGFTVDVLGTVFAVELDGVEVTRGAVRITSPSGAVLVERLAAGERWSNARTVRAGAPPPVADEPAAGEPEADEHTADEPVAGEPDEIAMDELDVATSTPRRAPVRSAQAWLGEARSLLAGGDVAGARAAVKQALAARPPRAVRADAEALIAESHLRAGELDVAVRHFTAVAERYRDLATGEAALFAAARYQARLGRGADARRLLETYLQRYPQGSLATQARTQLRNLGAP